MPVALPGPDFFVIDFTRDKTAALSLARRLRDLGASVARDIISRGLEESVAYADSASDLAMLEAVGFPVAVNPEARLAAIARRRGWHVEHWAKAEGGSARPLPLGPFDVISPKAVMGR